MDIYFVVKIGMGVMIDYVYFIVIGEIVVVGNDVLMLYFVMLGGIGKEDGDCYFKIGNGVMIGVGVKVFGNIYVGYYFCIVVGLVVLSDVLLCKIVVGVLVWIVGDVGCIEFLNSMN